MGRVGVRVLFTVRDAPDEDGVEGSPAGRDADLTVEAVAMLVGTQHDSDLHAHRVCNNVASGRASTKIDCTHLVRKGTERDDAAATMLDLSSDRSGAAC